MAMLFPSVLTREIDRSDYAPRIATTIAGFVGVANKGPLHVPTLITSEAELIDTFGEPPNLGAGRNEKQVVTITGAPTGGTFRLTLSGQQTGTIAYNATATTVRDALVALPLIGSASNINVTGNAGGPWTVEFRAALGLRNMPLMTTTSSLTGGTSPAVAATTLLGGTTPPGDFGMIAALQFLRQGRQMYFVRTCQYQANTGWLATTAKTASSGGGAVLWDTGNSYAAVFNASSAGDWGNSLQLRFTKIDGNYTDEVQTVTTGGASGGTFTLTFKGQTTATIAFNAAASAVQTALEALSTVGAGNVTVTGTGPWTVTFRNVLGRSDQPLLVINGGSLTGGTPAVTLATAGGTSLPSTSVYRLDILRPLDDNGRMEVAETFDRVMLVNHTDTLNTYNAYWIVDAVNYGIRNAMPKSQIVNIDEATIPQTLNDVVTELAQVNTPVTYGFSGGFSALNTKAGTADEYSAAYIGTEVDPIYGATALQGLANPQRLDVNLVSLPGVDSEAALTALVALCESRKDCMAVLDTPPGLTYKEAIDWHNKSGAWAIAGFRPNSSYAALYWPWVRSYDVYNRQEVVLPPSCFVPAQIAYNDQVAAPWYAPAGPKRGRITGLGLETSTPGLGALETMYSGGNVINVITEARQEGLTIMGQRTTQRRPTALDRINVRRLMIVIQKTIASSVRYLLFDPNDEQTRNEFVNLVTPVMEQVKNGRGVYDFKVICDENLNPPSVVDRSELKGVILLKPVKAAEFITVDFTLLSTGADFSIPSESRI